MAYGTLSFTLAKAAKELAATSSLPALRLTLIRGEALRLPRGTSGLRVISGNAWLSIGRDDSVLRSGENFALPKGLRNPAVVSALGEEELFLVVE